MKTYNDITIPPIIRVDRIISAFENIIDQDKLDLYTETMKAEMLSHDFPPILGFPTIITDDDTNDFFISGEKITEEHIGQLAWKVTDGHHRSLAAIKAGLPHLEVNLDYSCITSEEDLKQHNS